MTSVIKLGSVTAQSFDSETRRAGREWPMGVRTAAHVVYMPLTVHNAVHWRTPILPNECAIRDVVSCVFSGTSVFGYYPQVVAVVTRTS